MKAINSEYLCYQFHNIAFHHFKQDFSLEIVCFFLDSLHWLYWKWPQRDSYPLFLTKMLWVTLHRNVTVLSETISWQTTFYLSQPQPSETWNIYCAWQSSFWFWQIFTRRLRSDQCFSLEEPNVKRKFPRLYARTNNPSLAWLEMKRVHESRVQFTAHVPSLIHCLAVLRPL